MLTFQQTFTPRKQKADWNGLREAETAVTHFPGMFCLPLGAHIRLSAIDGQYLFLILVLFFGRAMTAELWPLCPRGPTDQAAVMSSTASLLSAPNYPTEAGKGDGREEEDPEAALCLLNPSITSH